MSKFVVLCVSLAVTVAVANALTWTVTDPDYAVQTVIPQLAAAPITFLANGDLIMLDVVYNPPCLFRWSNAANLPFGSTIPFSYGLSCASQGGHSILGAGSGNIVATKSGRIYQSSGLEIDLNTFTTRQAFTNCAAGHGIALDPTDDSLLFSNYGSKKIYRVPNPDVHPTMQTVNCNAPFFDAGALVGSGIDGLTVGPDGTVYMAAYDSASLVIVSKTGQLIANKPTGKPRTQGPDGISICIGDGNSFALTSTAQLGQIVKFNLTGPGGAPDYDFSTIATNGGVGYIDWTAVDPRGCIWGSTVNGGGGVFRVSNKDGTCPSCNAPQVPPSGDCPDCTDVVHVSPAQVAAGSATANSNGKCVALHFD